MMVINAQMMQYVKVVITNVKLDVVVKKLIIIVLNVDQMENVLNVNQIIN